MGSKSKTLISVAKDIESKIIEDKSEFISRGINGIFGDKNSGLYSDTADLALIKVDEILDPQRDKTDIEQKLIDAANDLTGYYGVSKDVYGPLIIILILSLLHERTHESTAIFNVLLSAAVHTHTLENGASKLGSLGGRPEHVRKKEAIELAKKRWEMTPQASISNVATYVKSKLESKYTDAPKLPSIKAWIKVVNVRVASK